MSCHYPINEDKTKKDLFLFSKIFKNIFKILTLWLIWLKKKY